MGARTSKVNVLMVGLDNAGKTTLLYHLRLRDAETGFTETNGYNHEVVQRIYDRKRFDFNIWDLAGKPTLRRLWKYFYKRSTPDVIMFVIDANDRKRFTEARTEILDIFREPEVVGVLKIVACNVKAEDDTKAGPDEIATALGVRDLKGMSIPVLEINAISGEGFDKLLNYVCMTMLRSRR